MVPGKGGQPNILMQTVRPTEGCFVAPDHVEDLGSFYIYTYKVLATESTSRIPIDTPTLSSRHQKKKKKKN